jgi:hypothetical protein
MAKIKSSIVPSTSESTRPETDAEHSQRFLNDIDRATWSGTHPPISKGPRGIVHKMGVLENVPHIFKAV